MSAIGKIINALVHGSQETTLALAQLNFDFSLVKLDAPPEFHGLGAALTKKRREIAEDGTSHITARKLGALFREILPPTPILIRQYGTRASEIAENRAVNPPASPADGIFAEHVGIDGTSIWAAATSGEGAIAVHLLACMLARMFSAPEAVSIWYELVENRKSEIQTSTENEPLHFATVAAAKINLSRDQLAEWDMSARSWLRTADEAKRAQQKQLMLIVRNVNIPVHSGGKGTYESVIGAWKTALTLMERLLRGEPQSVQGGDLLLGVASWHIYPNLRVFGDRQVLQDDPLVPEAGVLSIGIESSPAQDDTGPVWSLPLSHFRYYGGPYTATRFMCDDSERLSLDEFLLVSLGSLLGSWDETSTQTLRLARIVSQVAFQLSSVSQPSEQTLWVRLLGQAANRLLDSSNEDQRVYKRLVSLGNRRASHLLRDIPTAFGLTHIPTFIRNMGHIEDKIELIRRVAHRLAETKQIDPKDLCVVYRFRGITDDFGSERGASVDRASEFVYTTVVAQEDALKRNSAGQPISRVRHARWIYYSNAEEKRIGEEYFSGLEKTLRNLRGTDPDDFRLYYYGGPTNSSEAAAWSTFRNNPPLNPFPEIDLWNTGSTDQTSHGAYGLTETSVVDLNVDLVDYETIVPSRQFTFVTGVDGDCGLYVKSKLGSRFFNDESDLNVTILDDVEWALSNHVFTLGSLLNSFRWASGLEFMGFKSVRAFAAVVKTYSDLTNSTIALKAIYRPLYDLKWAKTYRSRGIGNEDLEENLDEVLDGSILPLSLSREVRFALLVYMETGHADVDPPTFDSVVAVCSGNSIFVSAPVILDPFESTSKSRARLRCLRGNIGRAGIVLLTTPEDPLMRSSNEANWKVIGHENFDGKLLDSFKGTSLQLGFTNFKLPIDTGNLGAYDMDLIFMEAIIRVNDYNGTWIGDLNILRAMEHWTCVDLPTDCHHEGNGRAASNIPYATAIDSWDEFLDEPNGAMVFRAQGNWVARLSAACFSGKQGERLVAIVPCRAEVCWSCLFKSVDQTKWSKLLLVC